MLELDTTEIQGDELIDQYEDMLSELPRVACPTEHHFWNGCYLRQITMPTGFQCTTKVHAMRHPFVISKGKVEVIDNLGGVNVYEAPFVGITEPGTRRALRVLEECVWTTWHMTEATNPEDAQKDLILLNQRAGIEYANARNEPPTLHD